MRCKTVSHKFEPFMYLSLPVIDLNSKISLNDCIKEFNKEEYLDRDERW